MEAEEIAARVWPGRELQLEPLGGGITNRNFKVECDGELFVLRIGGKDTNLLGIDRYAEQAAARAAADIGVGADVVAFVEPEGYLVTRFVDGEPVPVDKIRRPAQYASTTRNESKRAGRVRPSWTRRRSAAISRSASASKLGGPA